MKPKPLWLKVMMGTSTIGAGVLGGLVAGPVGALVGGLTALTGVLGGLYHEPPAPRPPKKNKRGQIADDEEPS